MKQIEPITIWINGENKSAIILNASIIQDNLDTSCSFYYQLCEALEADEEALMITSVLVDGNLIMSGESYLQWNGSNDAAYTYIAKQLNLTLV